MVCFDEMDPDKAVVLVTFEGSGSAYSEDLNNVAYSHCNSLVATSRCRLANLKVVSPFRRCICSVYCAPTARPCMKWFVCVV